MTTAPARPPFSYFGGKMGLAPQIASLLPPHELYVEPFAGSLAVLLAKRPAAIEIVNDLDGDLVRFWRVLRDQGPALIRACALTPHSLADFELARDRPADLPDLEHARRTWVRLAHGVSGSLRASGWRRYVDPLAAAGASVPERVQGYVGRMEAAAERLIGVTLECRPAAELIADVAHLPGAVVYCDPPYLASTRASGKKYVHELQAVAEHEALLEQLLAVAGTVVLSGYPSPLYAEALSGWSRVELIGRAGTRRGGSKPVTRETVWINRPVPSQLALLER